MVQILKVDRNERIYSLRKQDSKKWTFKKLGREFNISYVRAHKIYSDLEKKLSTGAN